MPKGRSPRKATASKKGKKKSVKKVRPTSKRAKTKAPSKAAAKASTRAARKAPAGKKAPAGTKAPAKAAQKARASARTFTESQLREMQARVQASPKLLAIFGFFNTFAQASEYQVIEMMVHNGKWTGPVPPDPGGNGSVEFGLFDYWLNNPGNDGVLQTLQKVWLYLVGSLPKTQINATNYQNLLKAVAPGQPGLVAADGTWFHESPYALDPLWTTAVIEYLYYLVFENYFQPFPQTPPTVQLRGASSSQVTLALVGDWGTGNYPNGPAASVMKSIVALKPDYIIHLGDVYYGGTELQEQTNLLGMWPAGYAGKSFTLNSNHEMYDGGWGYFKTALGSNIFSAQRGTSYFALQYGSYAIMCLDSAYWSTWPMVMDGSIQEASGESGAMAQPQFIQKLVRNGLKPQNVIVLTHHNPIAYDGSELVTDELNNNLWAQVTQAFGGTPTAWYWGHVHNGIVYPNPTFTGNKVYGRCVGHGALPYGNAWGLAAAPPSQVRSYANTPNPTLPPRVMNGFLLLTITTTGQVTEVFYQQNGSPAPWARPFFYQLG